MSMKSMVATSSLTSTIVASVEPGDDPGGHGREPS
jgi:hypothetical protein